MRVLADLCGGPWLRLPLAVARGLAESIRETLPSEERDAGPFVSGAVWAFLIHWGTLILVTLAYCSNRGGC
jgi:hypothetical protein